MFSASIPVFAINLLASFLSGVRATHRADNSYVYHTSPGLLPVRVPTALTTFFFQRKKMSSGVGTVTREGFSHLGKELQEPLYR